MLVGFGYVGQGGSRSDRYSARLFSFSVVLAAGVATGVSAGIFRLCCPCDRCSERCIGRRFCRFLFVKIVVSTYKVRQTVVEEWVVDAFAIPPSRARRRERRGDQTCRDS